MLNLMRKHARNWLMKVLLGIIIVVFIFYFGSTSGRQKAETVAIVGDKSFSYADFQKNYENLVELYRQKFGGALPPEVLKELNLKQQARDNMINTEILMQKAAELAVEVTEEEIKGTILSYPAFQRNGAFDERLYRQTLQLNKITPEAFEADQKQTITAAKIGFLIQDAVKVSDQEAYDLYRLQSEQMNVSFLQFPAANFRGNVTSSTGDLDAYLKERSAEFRVPEQVRIHYLTFSADDFSSTMKVTDEDIRDYYERGKERWTKGGKTTPLSEAKDKIVAELKQTSSMRKAFELAKSAHDTIYQEENFEGYATKNKLKVRTTDFFTAKNPPQEFRQISDFAESVFSLKNNEVSGILKGEGTYYLVKLAARKASYTPTLKEIVPEVERRYREKEAARLAEKAAKAALERLRKGETLEKIAAEKGLKINETGMFLPGSSVPKLEFSPALNSVLFQISEKNPYPDAVLDTGGSFTIIRFKERKKADGGDFAAKKTALKNFLTEMGRNEMMKSWMENCKAIMMKEGTIQLTRDIKDL
ncbi:MAG: SurA N-terminal domain-containing protein [Deltaproteobacteria bacterium]|nr:SurA N-terminal domain-containing protein [Deltaproteobacteria bacterium]